MKKILSIIVMIIISSFLIGCDQFNIITKSKKPVLNEQDLGVYTVSSKEELEKLVTQYYRYMYRSNDAKEGSIPTDDSENETEREYQTNNQVEGVDEGDIVKVDGNFIYYVINHLFFAFEQTPEGLITRYSEKFGYCTNDDNNKLSQEYEMYYSYPEELYLTDQYIVLILATSVQIDKSNEYTGLNLNFSEVRIYDKTTFDCVKTLCVQGNKVTSRLTNNNLFFIVSSYNDIDQELRPKIIIDGNAKYPEYHEIKYIKLYDYATPYTLIFNIVLENEITISEYYFLGINSWGNYYITEKQIYFINSDYQSNNIGGYESYSYTNITIFDICNNESIAFGGSFNVKGAINDNYWFDVNDDTIRFVTSGNDYYNYQNHIYNYFYAYKRVLSENKYQFELISNITEGIGKPNERVKSVRFNENRVTIVTFVQTDPLYYIDLTDITKPIITSELIISGFSTYQHPINENYIFGIGYEADDNGITNGVKIALYDISDKYNISVVGNPLVIPNASFDIKTIMLDLTNDIFGITIGKWTDNQYGNYFLLLRIDINATEPIDVLDTISYETNNASEYEYDCTIKRMVFINEYYYVLTKAYIASYKLVNDELIIVDRINY